MRNSTSTGLSTPTFLSFILSMLVQLLFVVTNYLVNFTIRVYDYFGVVNVVIRLETFVSNSFSPSTFGLSNSFGHVDTAGIKSEAKALLVVIILILIIPAVGLVFTGGTTGSTGVYTNTTVAANARTGIVQFSQFIGIAMILGVVGVIVGLVG